MRHIYFHLSRNGLASGIEAKVRDIMIPIEQQDAVSGLVYDIVVFYTRILQIQNNEFRTLV